MISRYEKLLDDMVERYGKHLYHYTSQETLLSILKGKEFWLTQVNQLKDKTEFKRGFDTLKNIVLRKISKEKQNIVFDLFNDVSSCDLYSMSFSNSYQNRTLWSNYAQHYKGVCIEFNTRSMFEIVQFCTRATLGFSRVSYDTNLENSQLVNAIVASVNECENYSNLRVKDILTSSIFLTSRSYKSKKFQAEREYRLANTFLPQKGSCPYLEDVYNIQEVTIKNKQRKIMKINMDLLFEKNGRTFKDCISKIYLYKRHKKESECLHKIRQEIQEEYPNLNKFHYYKED